MLKVVVHYPSPPRLSVEELQPGRVYLGYYPQQPDNVAPALVVGVKKSAEYHSSQGKHVVYGVILSSGAILSDYNSAWTFIEVNATITNHE